MRGRPDLARGTNSSDRLISAGGRIFKLSLAALGLFLALEITVRISFFGLAGLDPRRVSLTGRLRPTTSLLTRSSPRQIREFLPDLDVFANLVRFRTNSRGLRDKEYALEKPANTFRVAVMGASFTLPWGVEIERAYHSVLEERFSAEYAPTRYEFVNFASTLTGPTNVLAKLRHRALAYDPDLILVNATTAVVPYYLLQGRQLRKLGWPPPGIRMPRALTGVGFRSYFWSRLKLWWAQTAEEKPLPTQPQIPPADGGPSDAVRSLAKISRETGIPVVVVRLEYQPTAPAPIEERLAARAADEGLYYVDTRHAFRGTTPKDFWVHGLDPHPNAQAHERFAAVLDEFLRANQLLGR